MAVVQSEGALADLQVWRRPTLHSALNLGTSGIIDYAELWRVQPNVRLVTGFLARNIAQLGLHAFEKVAEADRRRLPPEHPLSRLIRRPNPYITRYQWTSALVHDLKVFDRHYSLILTNQVTGEPRLFRLPPSMVTPVGSWYAPDAYELRGAGAFLSVPAGQVFDIHGYNPLDPRVGSSPLEALRAILAEEAEASKWREQYWRGAARISGVLQRPKDTARWSTEARDRFRADWQSVWAGNGVGAGATPILEEGMEWKEASFSPKDSEYLAARRLSREEVAAAYFVSPLFVGILDHANFSNVSEQHKHLYQDTLGPDLVMIEEEWERQIVPLFQDLDPDRAYVEFNLAEKLKGTFEEQAAVMSSLVGRPIMSASEGRARMNLPPTGNPADDELVVPLNVLLGGQASPRDSAPPLGSGAASRHAHGTKSLPHQLTGWEAKHVEVLTGFFNRQKSTVMSRLGAGQTVAEAWDTSRWDSELETDLFSVAANMATDVATPVADRFGGTYDPDVALAYLQESARIAAENINTTTKAALEAAYTQTGTAGRKDIFDPELDQPTPIEAAAAVFAAALTARIAQIALTRTTATAGFAAHEGARQAGVTHKVWLVNSATPRADHPSDGETVPLDGTFSNGARWPGDAGAGVDQTAGCTCSLDFTTEA